MLLPLLAEKAPNPVPPVPSVADFVAPLLVEDSTQAAQPRRNDEFKQELRIAISYLLLAGLNGLLGSGTESGRHWSLKGFTAKHAPPIWRPAPRDGASLRD